MQLSIINMILNAGPVGQSVMFALLVFSIVSWTIIISKSRLFHKVRLDSEDFLETFWNSNNLSQAHSAAKEFDYAPQAAIFSAGFTELQKIKKLHKDSAVGKTLETQLATMDNLKRTIRKISIQKTNELARNLPFLATTGATTPFIGLFGTVWGIMASFHDIGQRGSASLAVVAPGISEALIATAAGLAVAIPAVIFYNFYANKLEAAESEMEDFSNDFLNLIERDLLSKVK